MTSQTFAVNQQPRVIIEQLSGDLEVHSWDNSSIRLETDDRVSELYQEGNALIIRNCDGDLELTVPIDTDILATDVDGDVEIHDVRRVELKSVNSDVELENIGADVDLENIGEAALLISLAADLHVTNVPALRSREGIGGDASISNVALVEIEAVGADLRIEQTEAVVVGEVGGNLDVEGVADTLRCGNVGGDCQVQSSADTEVILGNIGGDLEIGSAARVQIGSVGGDCDLRNVQDVVEVGNVGGDARIIDIGGNLQVGNIGGDGELLGLQGNIEAGSVGGDLELQGTFPAGSRTRMNIGGDASVELPDNPNLNIRAAVGGEVSGSSIAFGSSGNLVNLAYGDGAAELELSVGGDLELRGAGSPRSSSSGGSWGDLKHDMADLGREMNRLGQELAREVTAIFNEAGWTKGAKWTKGWTKGANPGDEISRKVEERVRQAQRRTEEAARKVEEQARRAQQRAEERARHANQKASRMRVRINDREWRMDPDRLERILEQAQRAADEGVAGAMEAVERAISKLRVPTPPKPPASPAPPDFTPPASPGAEPSMPGVAPAPEQPAQTGTEGAVQSEQSGSHGTAAATSSASEPELEQEREAILRMIAEGRISPEEGDMLLEGLGS